MVKYYAKAKTKIAKLDKLIKDIFPHIFSKNFLNSFITKFINKLIEKKNIFTQKIYHLFLSLNLTSLSCLVNSINVQPQKQLNYTLLFTNKRDYLLVDIYLEKYCDCLEEIEEKILYQMYTFYNWFSKLRFILCTQKIHYFEP